MMQLVSLVICKHVILLFSGRLYVVKKLLTTVCFNSQGDGREPDLRELGVYPRMRPSSILWLRGKREANTG